MYLSPHSLHSSGQQRVTLPLSVPLEMHMCTLYQAAWILPLSDIGAHLHTSTYVLHRSVGSLGKTHRSRPRPLQPG